MPFASAGESRSRVEWPVAQAVGRCHLRRPSRRAPWLAVVQPCRGMLPLLGARPRRVVTLEESPDVFDLEKRYRSLRLPVGVEDLPDMYVRLGPVGIAPSVLPVVGHDHELEHVVVQRKCHLVECLDVLIQRRDRQDIRYIPQVRSQAEIRRVVAHSRRQPSGPGILLVRPWVADQPLTGTKALQTVCTRVVQFLLFPGKMLLPLSPSPDLKPVGVRPLRNHPQRGVDQRLPQEELFVGQPGQDDRSVSPCEPDQMCINVPWMDRQLGRISQSSRPSLPLCVSLNASIRSIAASAADR